MRSAELPLMSSLTYPKKDYLLLYLPPGSMRTNRPGDFTSSQHFEPVWRPKLADGFVQPRGLRSATLSTYQGYVLSLTNFDKSIQSSLKVFLHLNETTLGGGIHRRGETSSQQCSMADSTVYLLLLAQAVVSSV
jgi:hypothetical protein